MTNRKVAIVTGANRGLGLEISKQLAAKGVLVFAGCRNTEEAPDALNENPLIQTRTLDLHSEETIVHLIDEIVSNGYGIDILINNAAIYLDNPRMNIKSDSLDSFTETLKTNVVGAYCMLKHVVPKMIEQKYGRVVNVSSGMGRLMEIDKEGLFYSISKLALNGLTVAYAKECKGMDILINAVCPGWVQTDMGGNIAPRTVSEGAQGVVWASMLPAGAETGCFFRDQKLLSWLKK